MNGIVVAYNGADAGLGNRIRVTLGGARYARWRGSRFAYVWPRSRHFQPGLTDLWEWDGGPHIPRALSRAAAWSTGYVGHDLTVVSERRILQIRTGGELLLPPEAGPWTEDLRSLVPVEEIATAVTRIHSTAFGMIPYVGVQIRAHEVSHSETRRSSPVEWFTGRMREILAGRPDTRFYISCDVPELKQRLLREFPTSVAHSVWAPYNSTSAVRAAIVDLYLLASSSYMLGPYYSSFVETAQFLAAMAVPTNKPSERDVPSGEWWKTETAVDPLQPSVRRSTR